METALRHIVLVSRRDRAWIRSCENALLERGIDAVEAHNCWSAELALERKAGEAVVIEAAALCEFVSAERPGPLLGLSPKQPVVIFDAEELDEQHRSAATANNAVMLEGDDVTEIARCADAVLPMS